MVHLRLELTLPSHIAGCWEFTHLFQFFNMCKEVLGGGVWGGEGGLGTTVDMQNTILSSTAGVGDPWCT